MISPRISTTRGDLGAETLRRELDQRAKIPVPKPTETSGQQAGAKTSASEEP